ncbi:MAG: Gldg family protein [Verrucomicrobia bacterium]|nr:GldG family protein [Kiritimatiellia bacterium]MCO6401044.1 Gldg family protein [Verrucomicrobiota bacterium]
MKRFGIHVVTGAVGLIVTLAVLVLLNVAASSVRVRADLTAEKLYTLAPGTRGLLKNLERDVTLKFYFSRSADAAPINFKQYGSRILDLLREYEKLSGGHLSLEVIDPQPDSDEEEWARRYGLTASRLTQESGAPSVFLGLVALSGARQSAIPFFSPADEPQLEFLISRAVNEVTVAKKPKIAVISPLPLMGGSAGFVRRGPNFDGWIIINELRAIAEIEDLSGQVEEIPADVDTLLLVYPRNLPEATLYAVDQFVLRGGRLFALEDPQCLADLDAQSSQFRDPKSAQADLNALTAGWGIKMSSDRVIADPAAATRVASQLGEVQLNNSWLTLRSSNFNREDVSVAAMNMMQFPMTGWFEVQPVDGLTVTPLITAGPEAGSVSIIEATSGTFAGKTTFEKATNALPIAIRVSGHFKTAFPNGRPSNVPAGATHAPPSEPDATHLAESVRDGTVVLVADADFLYDAFAARRLPMFGPGVYQLMNDNINFAANVAGQLAGGDALIALRGRGTFERPFTRVLALRTSAQEKWREQELKLQEQLATTQANLDRLQSGKSEDQQLIISPEQRQEIERFRAQQLETRRALKEVRKNLNHEIEALGLWVKALNIGAMPGLVILFGLAHGWRRRRRARSR